MLEGQTLAAAEAPSKGAIVKATLIALAVALVLSLSPCCRPNKASIL
jgi:hypothetical protein